MKIWITRKSASCIQFGGLERLQVWFQKPNYYYYGYKPYDSPFSDSPQHLYGIRDDGWRVGSGPFQNYVPFSKVFGYADTDFQNQNAFALWVWSELEKHFDNAPFDDWDKLERQNPDKYHIRKFMLHAEFDINFDINTSFKTVYDLSGEPVYKPRE